MREEILKCLRESEEYLSGQQLCERFQVSRTAIWKVIGQLKEEGYEIEAVKNRGYRLKSVPDLVNQEAVSSLLKTEWAGNTVFFQEEQASTNQTAKMMAEAGAKHGTLVIAERQTMGKGRRGRIWHSPAGSGIWMSMVLRPNIAPSNASMLTLVAAMAVYDVLSTRIESCRIKWPNDLVLDGRKVCGILTEMSAEFDAVHYVVIGIGINVNTESFPKDIASVATSMYDISGKHYNRSEIIAEIWSAFEKYYEQFMAVSDLTLLMDTYNERLINRDRRVYIGTGIATNNGETAGTSMEGTAKGIDAMGCLQVELDNGQIVPVLSGEVSVRGVLGYT